MKIFRIKSVIKNNICFQIKSLTESKSEINDKNIENQCSNGSTTKKVKNKNYSDLPKHGFHYLFHKIKTQLMPSYESDESYIKTDTITPSEVIVTLTEIIKQEFGHAGSKSEHLKNSSVHKQSEKVKVDVNLNCMKDADIELGNLFGSTDQTVEKASQSKSGVVTIDLTDDVEDDPKVDFDDFGDNGESSSNKSNIAARSKDSRLPNVGKSKSFGACISGSLKNSNVKSSSNDASVNAKSAGIKNKTSNEYDQTINQAKIVDYRKMKQYEFGCSKPTREKPHPNISKGNFEDTVYNEANAVVQNTPPRGNKRMVKSRPTGHNDVHLPGSGSTGIPIRQNLSKVSSFYRTSYTEMQANKSESKSPRAKFKSLLKTKGINQYHYAMISSERTVNKINSNRSIFGHNNIEPNSSFGNSVLPNNDILKANRSGDTFRKDQYLFAQNNLKNSAHVNVAIYDSTLQTQVPASKFRETSCSDSRGILKANAFDSTTRRSQNSRTLGKTSQANKSDKKQSSFSITDGKQTYLHSSKGTFAYKNISKKKPVAETTHNLRTSDGDYGPPKGMDGGLGSDEDLFGSDDGLDELLAKSFTDDLDYNNRLDTPGENNDLKWTQKNVMNDDGSVKDFLGNLENDLDDDTLIACCDDALSPTISVREKVPNSGISRLSRNEIPLKGVKRKLNIPDAQSKIRKPNISSSIGYSRDLGKKGKEKDGGGAKIRECPFCAKSFHSG